MLRILLATALLACVCSYALGYNGGMDTTKKSEAMQAVLSSLAPHEKNILPPIESNTRPVSAFKAPVESAADNKQSDTPFSQFVKGKPYPHLSSHIHPFR